MAERGVQGLSAWLRKVDHVPRDAHEALAMAVHGLLLQHGFRSADQAVGEPAEEQPSRLPPSWGVGGYGGRYRHHRSALMYDVRALAVGRRLVVHATIVEQDDSLHTLELPVDRYVAQTIDFEAWQRGTPAARATTDTDALQQQAQEFSWDNVLVNTLDLATLVQVNIAHRLVPDAAKDGYEAAAEAGTLPSAPASIVGGGSDGGASSTHPPRPVPVPGPGIMPHAEDPLRIGPPMMPSRNPYYGIPGMDPGIDPSPYGLGHDDLLPAGLRGGGDGMGGRLIPGPGFGGNLMGPGHPLFGGGGRVGGMGRGGGGRVPGARFDPYGPPDPYGGYGPGPGRIGPGGGVVGGGTRGGGGGGVGGPQQGDPDNDIERPARPENEHGVPEPPPPDMYF